VARLTPSNSGWCGPLKSDLFVLKETLINDN
jgi:hypothetical protein